eukprot:6206500-Pleurochrysis_carterae.AAC.1
MMGKPTNECKRFCYLYPKQANDRVGAEKLESCVAPLSRAGQNQFATAIKMCFLLSLLAYELVRLDDVPLRKGRKQLFACQAPSEFDCTHESCMRPMLRAVRFHLVVSGASSSLCDARHSHTCRPQKCKRAQMVDLERTSWTSSSSANSIGKVLRCT